MKDNSISQELGALSQEVKTNTDKLLELSERRRVAQFESNNASTLANIDSEIEAVTAKIRLLVSNTAIIAAMVTEASDLFKDFQKTIFTVSIGALALSVTFSGSLIPAAAPSGIIYLRIAWVAFTTVVLAYPLNIFFALSAKVLDAYRKTYDSLSVAAFTIGMTAFFVGILSFLAFALVNLPRA